MTDFMDNMWISYRYGNCVTEAQRNMVIAVFGYLCRATGERQGELKVHRELPGGSYQDIMSITLPDGTGFSLAGELTKGLMFAKKAMTTKDRRCLVDVCGNKGPAAGGIRVRVCKPDGTEETWVVCFGAGNQNKYNETFAMGAVMALDAVSDCEFRIDELTTADPDLAQIYDCLSDPVAQIFAQQK